MEEMSAGKQFMGLWENGMPGNDMGGCERLAYAELNDGIIRLTDVSRPGLCFFPAQGPEPRPVMIVCPGGAYELLAWDKEGTEIASWLNARGISALVLKYRVPGKREDALMDAQRAIRLVRARHGELGVDSNRLGIMGFSAGAHLSAMAAISEGKAVYEKTDAVDDESPVPDYAVLVYPAYLNEANDIAPEFSRLGKVPPLLLLHNEMDVTFVPGTKIFTRCLQAQGYDVTTKIWKEGGHGYGLRSDKDVKAWPEAMVDWMVAKGYC